jgi:hypothetical protein
MLTERTRSVHTQKTHQIKYPEIILNSFSIEDFAPLKLPYLKTWPIKNDERSGRAFQRCLMFMNGWSNVISIVVESSQDHADLCWATKGCHRPVVIKIVAVQSAP